jgi:hypothetical protein
MSRMASRGTVEKYASLDINDLHRVGALRDNYVTFPWVGFRWPGLVRLNANRWRIDLEFRCGRRQTIPVVWTRCNFGGGRPWFKCHGCDRRTRKLYSTEVSYWCRQCLELRYASQQRGAKSRSYLQALKLRLRLNDIAKIGGPVPDRPRRMHKRTYQRLCQRLEKHEQNLHRSPRFMSRETDYGPLVPR